MTVPPEQHLMVPRAALSAELLRTPPLSVAHCLLGNTSVRYRENVEDDGADLS